PDAPSAAPMHVVASTHPLESEPRRPSAEILELAEPKVQVDPTLIEPLLPMPADPTPTPNGAPPAVGPLGSQPVIEPPMAASSSSGMRLQHLLTPVPGFMPPYAAPADPGQAAAPFPAPTSGGTGGFPGAHAHYPSGAIAPIRPPRRTRMIVITASAAL